MWSLAYICSVALSRRRAGASGNLHHLFCHSRSFRLLCASFLPPILPHRYCQQLSELGGMQLSAANPGKEPQRNKLVSELIPATSWKFSRNFRSCLLESKGRRDHSEMEEQKLLMCFQALWNSSPELQAWECLVELAHGHKEGHLIHRDEKNWSRSQNPGKVLFPKKEDQMKSAPNMST